MALTLGKRKRAAPAERKREGSLDSNDSGEGEEDAQAVFKRHFEARFEPLPEVFVKGALEVDGEEEERVENEWEETDWDGISEDGDNELVEVIEHTAYRAPLAAMPKEELKAFMTSKIPTAKATASTLKPIIAPAEDDLSEAAHLKHDLALQRLLAESHLFDASSSPTLSGTNRHKATDLRLLALGSKKSILTQEKMPFAHRQGIVAKKSEREETRRREATENGIILERATSGKGKGSRKEGSGRRRERDVGGPGVGKFSSGMLTLSKKDILEIEGPRKSVGGQRGRGGGSRGRGRGGKREKSRA